EAQATLEGEGFRVKRASAQSTAEQRDRVIKQDPQANDQVEERSEVTITIGAGPATAAVPDVVGRTLDEASQAIIDAGFVPSQKAEENNDVEDGVVIRTAPAANSQAAVGSTVTIFYSSGPKTI